MKPVFTSAGCQSNGFLTATPTAWRMRWQLKYFGTLGQDRVCRAPIVDGLPLMVENAFDFSPTNNNLNSPRLPHFTAGTTAPVALVYPVPATMTGFYDYFFF